MATANSKLLIDFGFNSRGTSNVNGDLNVTGSLSVNGNLTFSGTTVGDFLPDQDQRSLGNTSNRWNLQGYVANIASTLTVAGTTTLQEPVTISKTLSSGNNTITGFANVTEGVNSSILTVGTAFIANTNGAFHTGTINAASFTTSGIRANTTAIVPTSNTILLGNSIGRFVISANSVDTISVQSGTIGAASNGFFANSINISLGNTSVNVAITTAGITSSGGTGVNPFSNTLGTALGTSTQRWVLNANTIDTSGLITGGAGATITGQVNASTGFGSGTIGAASNGLFANATTVSLGNTSVNVAITPLGITSSGSTGVNPSSNSLGTTLGTSTQRWVLNANTGNFSGALTVSGMTTLTGNATLSGTLQTIAGNVNFDTGTLFVDATNNRVGINNTAPTVAFEVTGAANISTSVNSSLFTVGTNFIANTDGVFHTGTINAASFTVGTNFVANSSAVTSVGIVNLTSNSSSIRVGNSTINSSTNSTVITISTGNFSNGANVGANVNLTTSSVQIGNSTANLNANSVLLKISNASSTANLSPSSLTIGSTVVNSSVVTIETGNFSTGANVGANVNISNTTIQIGNSTANLNANSVLLKISDASSTANLTSSNLTIGTTVVNSSVIAISTGNFSTGANVGANVNITNSTIQIGNSSVNTQISSTSLSTNTGNFSLAANVGANVKLTTVLLSIGNSSVNSSVNSTSLFTNGSVVVGTSFIANNSGVFHTGVVNAASYTTSGFVANTTAIVPTSNTILLGNTVGRFVISANTGNFTGTVTGTVANMSTSVNSAQLTVGTAFIANTNGAFHTGTIQALTFNSTSDVNSKYNIKTIEDPMSKLSKLRGVTFIWKDSDKPSMGLIAQEVEPIIPEVVTTDSEGKKSVSYDNIIGLLVESIKEQQLQIDLLMADKVARDGN